MINISVEEMDFWGNTDEIRIWLCLMIKIRLEPLISKRVLLSKKPEEIHT